MNKPTTIVNLSELCGILFQLIAIGNLLLAGSGVVASYSLAWILLSIGCFILGVLWRIHEWQVYQIGLNEPREPPVAKPPPPRKTWDENE